MSTIQENVQRLQKELPAGVILEAAAKGRSLEEVEEVIRAGVTVIGENYVQEAEQAAPVIRGRARLHFIGHLQTNKAKKAAVLFDMIETLDSKNLAEELEKRCGRIGKVMEVLIEVNSGREQQKSGVLPEDAGSLIRDISRLEHLRIRGLMTMGPYAGDPGEARPYFVETRKLFQRIRGLNLPGVEMEILSMGMTNSYRVALEEGANLIRIGTLIFGPRQE